jgi:hypothetical protein
LRQLIFSALRLLFLAATAAAPLFAQLPPLSDRDINVPGDWYMETGEPGLYPGGANLPSGAHLAYGLARTGLITPLDSATMTSSAPAIGFAVIGMSNANQEWGRFTWRAASDTVTHPRVVLVNAAQAGTGAQEMDDPADPYWNFFDLRVAAAGLGLDQIQVVWLKQSLEGGGAPYPIGPDALRLSLANIVAIVAARCPNLQVVYLASRIWGGSEPRNFETAFAVKGLIQDQVTAIGTGTATGPWLAWGPYLWADGANPRSDGLTWSAADLENDLTHPSDLGEDKVATLLEDFFSSDPRTTPWFLPAPGLPALVRAATDDAHTDANLPTTNFGAGASLNWATGTRIYLRFDLTGLAGIERALLTLRVDSAAGPGGGFLHLGASSSWSEATITAANAPALGAQIRTFPATGRGGVSSLDVTAAVQAAVALGDNDITFVLVPPATVAVPGAAKANESGEGPLLLLAGPDFSSEGLIFIDSFETGDTSSWSVSVG